MPPTTDVFRRGVPEDVDMPSIWIILAAAVGAINLRLIIPAVTAFFGFGRWSAPSGRRVV
jgi:hypothetical protein